MLRAKTLTLLLPVAALAGFVFAGCGSSDSSTTDPGVTCTPSTELCNGVDDNCNGNIDEGLTQACTDNGASGTQTCSNGQWGTCETECTPVAETCNGKDDDCDNAVDEDTSGNALTQACDVNGIPGTQACAQGAWGTCESSCTPAAETCNGQDDDCDALVDEGDDGQPLKQDCSNDCGIGTEVCAGGQYTSCTAQQPSTEECDGVDNDCDGTIDDGFECAKGDQGSCGQDKGECEFGTRVCGNTCQWGNCVGGVNPGTEVCEGSKDEDCDGTVDNACGCTNGATKECCGGTSLTCTGGTWPTCPAAPVETCNAIDDDCNGKVDDALPYNPYQIDEDLSNINDCDHAKALTAIMEGSTPSSFEYHLYKPDGTADKDYFLFRADENSDYFGCLGTTGYECYTVVVTLDSPVGAADKFCVYDVGFESSAATCAAPEQKVCSTSGSNEVTLNWAGDCMLSDNRYFYIEVEPAGADLSCKPYTITIEHLDNEPQDDVCSF